jgi:hypothetical protein
VALVVVEMVEVLTALVLLAASILAVGAVAVADTNHHPIITMDFREGLVSLFFVTPLLTQLQLGLALLRQLQLLAQTK